MLQKEINPTLLDIAASTDSQGECVSRLEIPEGSVTRGAEDFLLYACRHRRICVCFWVGVCMDAYIASVSTAKEHWLCLPHTADS